MHPTRDAFWVRYLFFPLTVWLSPSSDCVANRCLWCYLFIDSTVPYFSLLRCLRVCVCVLISFAFFNNALRWRLWAQCHSRKNALRVFQAKHFNKRREDESRWVTLGCLTLGSRRPLVDAEKMTCCCWKTCLLCCFHTQTPFANIINIMGLSISWRSCERIILC